MRAAAAALALLAAGPAASSPAERGSEFETAGLRIGLSATPGPEGMSVALTVAESASGRPLGGLRPQAWMLRRRSEMVARETDCADKVKVLAAGRLFLQADLDLNAYRVLTLNTDGSIAVINPIGGMQTTRLEAVLPLPEAATDWALDTVARRLLVAMPGADAVGVVDPDTWRLGATLPTGSGSRPARLALRPGSRLAWALLEGSGSVAALDPAAQRVDAVVPVAAGTGPMALALDDEGRFALALAAEAGRAVLLDGLSAAPLAEFELGAPAAPTVAWDSASRRFHLVLPGADAVVAIEPAHRSLTRVATPAGPERIAFAPEGRFGLLLHPGHSHVSLLDTALSRIIAAAETPATAAREVAFSGAFAYLRGGPQVSPERLALYRLADLRRGVLEPVEAFAGTRGPEGVAWPVAASATMVASPEGDGVIVANAADRMLYYMRDGMHYPAGPLRTYGRVPVGVLVHDRSLAEAAPGLYQIRTAPPPPGRYDVAVRLPTLGVVHCFETAVAPPAQRDALQADPAAARPVVAALFEDGRLAAGAGPVTLRFALREPATGEPLTGLRDAEAAVSEASGNARRLVPLAEARPGVYEAAIRLPSPGRWRIEMRAASRRLGFRDSPARLLEVFDEMTGEPR